jgi:ABC-type Fe3+ transport system permease subunit
VDLWFNGAVGVVKYARVMGAGGGGVRAWGRGVARRGASWVVVGVVLVCCGLPVLWLGWSVVSNPVVLGEMRVDGFRAQLLGRTVLYNLLAGVVAVVLALPAAVVLGRGRGWTVVVMWFLLPVTLLLPSIAYAYGWSQFVRLMGPVVGPVLSWVETHGWLSVGFFGVRVVGEGREASAVLELAGRADVARCIWSLATWLWALPAVVIGLSLRRMDSNVQQQALLDGALWRVTGRQMAGPVVASVAIVSLLSMQEYAVYEPTGISVVATEVRMVFDTGAFGSPENPIITPGGGLPAAGGRATMDQAARAGAAVAVSLPLLVIIGVLGVIAVVGVRRGGAEGAVAVGEWPRTLNPSWVLWVVTVGVVLVAVGVPVVSMLLSLRRELDLWRMFQVVRPQAVGSLWIAGMTGAVAVGLALLATGRRQRWVLVVAVVSFLVGGQMLAIGLIRIYNQPWLGWIYNAPPIMVMAYIGRFGWIALLAAALTWGRSWREVREMSAVDGAGPGRTMVHVIWPLAWPICAAAGVLLMILGLTEVPATVLLSPQRPPMLIPLLMTWVHLLRNDDMLEGALLLVVMVLVLALVAVVLVWLGMRVFRGIGWLR